MPEYVYRAVTKNGIIVKNKVEEASKQALIKRLKSNELMPIQIVQVGYIGKLGKTQKKVKIIQSFHFFAIKNKDSKKKYIIKRV